MCLAVVCVEDGFSQIWSHLWHDIGQSYLVVGYCGLKQNGKELSQPGKRFTQQIFFVNDKTDLPSHVPE